MIVIIDCLMTFFGSSANDAAFNAFVTDTTSENNRGKVESVLSILPLLSLIIVIVIAGFFVDVPVGEIKRWNMFFYVFGGITLLVGIASLFLIPKDTAVPNKANYWGNVIYGFRPKVIKENPVLYTLLAFTVFNIGLQVFMPYFILYVQNVLLITGSDFTICLGIVLLVASALTVIFGLFMDKIGKNKIMIPALIVGALGGMLVFLVPANQDITIAGMVIGGIVLMTGYLVSTVVLGAKIVTILLALRLVYFRRTYDLLCTCTDGHWSAIAQALCQIGGESYTNEFGQLVYPPNKWLFFVTGVIFLMAIVPVIFMMKKERQIINEK